MVITDRMWARLLSSTNQPSFMKPKDVVAETKQENQSHETEKSATLALAAKQKEKPASSVVENHVNGQKLTSNGLSNGF